MDERCILKIFLFWFMFFFFFASILSCLSHHIQMDINESKICIYGTRNVITNKKKGIPIPLKIFK